MTTKIQLLNRFVRSILTFGGASNVTCTITCYFLNSFEKDCNKINIISLLSKLIFVNRPIEGVVKLSDP